MIRPTRTHEAWRKGKGEDGGGLINRWVAAIYFNFITRLISLYCYRA